MPVDWTDPDAVRAYKRAWEAENRDRVNAQKRARRQARLEEVREYDRDYKRAHYDPDAAVAKNAAQYAKHGPATRQRASAWRKTNPQMTNAQARRRRERKQAADRSDPPTEAYELLLLADPCSYCRGPVAVIDHIVPLVAGGSGNVDNLTGACVGCNASKSARSLLYFLLTRKASL